MKGIIHKLKRRLNCFKSRPAEVACFSMSLDSRKKRRILLIAIYDPSGLQTIADNISQLCLLSRFRYDILNLWFRNSSMPEIPDTVNLSHYDAIFIHCTASYNPVNLLSLDKNRKEKIADYRGLKIMMKQDEHFRTNQIVDYLARNGFNLLLTCVPQSEHHKVYPEKKLPGLAFLHIMTGYVTDEMRELKYTQFQDRSVDIGYRGSIQPYCFGRLCYEKFSIGEVFLNICQERGLVTDISSRWEDRFPGREWYNFLGRLKGVLGVESGTTLFDFTGEIENTCENYLKTHPDADFEEVFNKILAPYENNVAYNQISPRHFEAAACKTVQILYEGTYSGILEPWVHYIPVYRDLCNVDKVFEIFLDLGERNRITEAAFNDVILNNKYHYSTFVKELDNMVEGLL